ncbi:MAG: DUF262 domain-containing protein [Anaerolineaceae bacterium]|nr:DUF262 domain-containing protein [Anaerolineaceae bacterium]
MPYQEETIKTIVDRLNKQYYLPAIQRHYIWKPDQVILLFDSIMRGYPISSFLFWELTHENRNKWEIYKFAELANSEGTSHTKQQSADGIHNVTLVLDGQQRLTSILIGLQGAFRIRKKYHWVSNPKAYGTYKLFMNMFEDPTPHDDDLEFTGKPYYGFKFFEKEPENSEKQHWFRVGRILDCHNDDAFYKLKDEEEARFFPGHPKQLENLFERNLWRLYQAIWKDAAISYYVERDQDYDRVLDIFVRANEAGTELNKAQILMAMFTSKWSINAKEQIEGFIHHLNNQLDRKNSLDLEFIMRTCLVLSDLPVRYRINNFTNQAISEIESNWNKMQEAIEKAVRLANHFGIDKSNLTSRNALIPMIYYLYHHPGVGFMGTTPYERKNASTMRRWLIMSLLNNVFGRSSEQVLTNLRRVLNNQKGNPDFPFDEMNKELTRMNYSIFLDELSIQKFLSATYPNVFLHLSLLYDDYLWGVMPHEKDHIFPQALFYPGNPVFGNLSPEKLDLFLSLRDRIGNLELLIERENREKQDTPFESWIQTRDKDFRARHLIPEGDELLKFENFEAFIEAREQLITKRLKSIIGPD